MVERVFPSLERARKEIEEFNSKRGTSQIEILVAEGQEAEKVFAIDHNIFRL